MTAVALVVAVAAVQPRLRCKLGVDSAEFTGSFVLNSPLGPFDKFDIRLVIPFHFPHEQPRVWETGGRLPRDIDRHVYDDGECCITVWESWLIGSESVTAADFLAGPLHNFFLAQHQVEKGQNWPFGEWRHGVQGRIDALAESLSLPSDDLIIARFLLSISKPNFNRHDTCPCGSGRSAHKCHRVVIDRARERIGQDRLFSIARDLIDVRLRLEKRAGAIARVASLIQPQTRLLSLKHTLFTGCSVQAIIRLLKPE